MSRHRRRPLRNRVHFYDGSDEPTRGPDGRPRCRWCKGSVPKPKRSFCSDACVHEWKVRTDPNYARDCVLSRDNGICAKCGRDTIAWWHELQLELRQAGFGIAPEICAARAAVYRRHGLSARGPGQRVSLWDVDHITPVSEGGGECGLEGLRTLCVICHRNETDALTARRYRESRPLLGDMEQAS